MGGRGATLNQRQGAEDRVEHNSDEESIDEFGRKKKKRRKVGAAVADAKASSVTKTDDKVALTAEKAPPAMSVLGRGPCEAGDWYCPSCDDLQFRKNIACRRCGAPKPASAGGNLSACTGSQSTDVELFLSKNR